MAKKSFKTSFDSLLGEEEIKPKINNEVKETRATFIIKVSSLEKLKAISYWERKTIKNILDEALTTYIEQYENQNGSIQLPK
jgi:hypothetical protein